MNQSLKRNHLTIWRIGALMGNCLYHYDTSLFSWIAPFLAPILFPNIPSDRALFFIFTFIPLGYMTRPFGSLFWGWLGDKYGRKPVMVATLTGTAIATLTIGLTPLGSRAWLIVALCRLLQGFFSAGGTQGTALYLLEHTSPQKQPSMSALYEASGIAGIFLASWLTGSFGQSYWRSLFFLGSLTALIGVILRKRGTESPSFTPSNPSWNLLWKERTTVCRIALVSGFSYGNYFMVTIFLNGFLPQVTSLSISQVLSFNLHLMWIDFILLLGFGRLLKWVSKEKLMKTAALLTGLLAFPLFGYLKGMNVWQVGCLRLTFVILGTAFAAPYHAWKFEMLPPRNRFLIGSISTSLGAQLFGASMPILASYLSIHDSGWFTYTGLPLTVLGLITTLVLNQNLGRLSKKVITPSSN